MSPKPDLVALGMRVVFDGKLTKLRKDLSLSRTGLAALMGVSPESLRKWESGRQGMKMSTAIRVAKWWLDVEEAVDQLDESVMLSDLIPVSAVVAHLGVGHRTVIQWCDDGEFKSERLGPLGYFIYRSELPVNIKVRTS